MDAGPLNPTPFPGVARRRLAPLGLQGLQGQQAGARQGRRVGAAQAAARQRRRHVIGHLLHVQELRWSSAEGCRGRAALALPAAARRPAWAAAHGAPQSPPPRQHLRRRNHVFNGGGRGGGADAFVPLAPRVGISLERPARSGGQQALRRACTQAAQAAGRPPPTPCRWRPPRGPRPGLPQLRVHHLLHLWRKLRAPLAAQRPLAPRLASDLAPPRLRLSARHARLQGAGQRRGGWWVSRHGTPCGPAGLPGCPCAGCASP